MFDPMKNIALRFSRVVAILATLVVSNLLAASGVAQDPARDQGRDPVSFKNDVMPILMRGGCNGGGCHGAARGKDGFKLSLFGYDPKGDHYRLLHEHFGRRINLAAPEKSMLLEKAAGTVAHTGGEIFKPDSEYYQTLKRWISEGAKNDLDEASLPVRLELDPPKIVFDSPNRKRQAKVIAHYDDGAKRDVSDLALYLTNNEAIATISNSAEIAGAQSGGTHVFARFDRFTIGTEVVVLPAGEFDWKNPPSNNYVDDLVFGKLKQLRVQPSGICTDEQFLRRVTLDLNGRMPTEDEYRAFMANKSPNKREQVIDHLMKRDSFGELWAAKWSEWLKIKPDTNPEAGTALKAGWNYYHWVRKAMVENRPWDEFATDLLTGNGSNIRNPPSNYYTMLPQGKFDPLKTGEDTAQIFLGIRTQCAMCHNHPFDRWTIEDYYGFTSFFTGIRRKKGTEAREHYTFIDVDAEHAKHPVDGRSMTPQYLGGGIADTQNKDARKVLATWMFDQNSLLFRRNLANRIWDHFFGRGIVHPVDDVRISNPASNEELLGELGRRLAEDYEYDARRLMKDVCMSRTYQLSATTNKSNERDESRFSHAYLRRLRPDVLFDNINQALGTTPSFRGSTADRAVQMYRGGQFSSGSRYFFQTFGQSARQTVCTCETVTQANLSQALHLINGRWVDDAVNKSGGLVEKLMKEYEYPKDASLEERNRAKPEIIQTLYVRFLSREPTAAELEKILAIQPKPTGTNKTVQMAEHRQYYRNVVWALLNSNEFIFNH